MIRTEPRLLLVWTCCALVELVMDSDIFAVWWSVAVRRRESTITGVKVSRVLIISGAESI